MTHFKRKRKNKTLDIYRISAELTPAMADKVIELQRTLKLECDTDLVRYLIDQFAEQNEI